MPVSAEASRNILPQPLKEVKLGENGSICSQIQTMLKSAGIEVSIKDFSQSGDDANTSFGESKLFSELTHLKDPQLSTILALIYDYRNDMPKDPEVVIGQLHKSEPLFVLIKDSRSKEKIDAELIVYVPVTESKNRFIGFAPWAIDSNGNIGLEKTGIINF